LSSSFFYCIFFFSFCPFPPSCVYLDIKFLLKLPFVCFERHLTLAFIITRLRTINRLVMHRQVPEPAEKGMFEHVSHSMEVIGITEEMRSDLWRVLSGILHLGNTAIVEADTVEGLKASIEEKRHAALAANMLGVPTEALIELLTLRRTIIRGQEIVIKLQKDEATFRRDAVAKALYASAFEWIVKCANDHLGFQEGETLPFIGVLDIFGFESFAVNGLEQVLINFANEYLQNVFNKQVIKREILLLFLFHLVLASLICHITDCLLHFLLF